MITLHLPSRQNATRIVAGALALVASFGAVRAWTLGLIASGTPGPGLVPLAIFLIILACAVVIVVRPPTEIELDEVSSRGEDGHEVIPTLNPVIAAVAATFGYIALMPVLGYLLATAIFAFALSRYAGTETIKASIVGAVLSLTSYLMFDVGLQLRLPPGIWG